jgi:hypothetical protein
MMRKPAMKTSVLLGLLILLHTQDLTTQQLDQAGSGVPSGTTELLFSQLDCSTLNYDAFYYAVKGLEWLDGNGLVDKSNLLAIIDYSLPSTEKRLFIIDVGQPSVLYRTLVAHGRNTGANEAQQFSNRMGSHQSCLGFFTTGRTYTGQNGYSMWLNGHDTTFNELARPRAIVMHGADYVSEEFISQYGRIGRSWGCPALPSTESHEIIDLIKEGVVVFGYYPDRAYFERSEIIRAITRDPSGFTPGTNG